MFFALIILTTILSTTMMIQPVDSPVQLSHLHNGTAQSIVIIVAGEEPSRLSNSMNASIEECEVNGKQKLTDLEEIGTILN